MVARGKAVIIVMRAGSGSMRVRFGRGSAGADWVVVSSSGRDVDSMCPFQGAGIHCRELSNSIES